MSTYRVTCWDHATMEMRTTEVGEYAEAKRLAYRATHAIKKLRFRRTVVKPLPHREVAISCGDREVIRYLGNTMVTQDTVLAKRTEILEALHPEVA